MQGIDDLAIKVVVRVVYAVVTGPCFEQVAKDEKLFGVTRMASQIIKEKAGDARCLR